MICACVWLLVVQFLCFFLFFFFFKQKTAYEMRISDWSSDVCSSDLGHRDRRQRGKDQRIHAGLGRPDDKRPGDAGEGQGPAVWPARQELNWCSDPKIGRAHV